MFKLMKHIDESKKKALQKLEEYEQRSDPYTFG